MAMEVVIMVKQNKPLSNKQLLYAILDILEVVVERMSRIGNITIISPEPISDNPTGEKEE